MLPLVTRLEESLVPASMKTTNPAKARGGGGGGGAEASGPDADAGSGGVGYETPSQAQASLLNEQLGGRLCKRGLAP